MGKLYKIAICDDDTMMSNNIKGIIENYFCMSRNDVCIELYSSSEEFLNSKNDIDYLFLDIEMPGMSGIELKELLQLEKHKFGIIFVTSYKQYKDEAFGKNVLAYIDKSSLYKIEKVLSKIEKNDSDFKIIKIGDDIVNSGNIFYLKANGGYVNVMTNTKEYMFCGTLFELKNRIDSEYFVQIHRSYIVNLKYVENKKYDTVVLSRKQSLPLSRKFKEKFEKKYFQYLKEV